MVCFNTFILSQIDQGLTRPLLDTIDVMVERMTRVLFDI